MDSIVVHSVRSAAILVAIKIKHIPCQLIGVAFGIVKSFTCKYLFFT